MKAPATVKNSRAESEHGRRWVHLAFGLGAFSLAYMDWRVASFLFLLAFVINSEILPRTQCCASLFRDQEGGVHNGIAAYPLVLFGLSLIFQEQLLIIAMAWVTMAFGDASAAYFGSKLGGATWPWNDDKRVVGSLAFVLASTLALALLLNQFEILSVLTLVLVTLIAAICALVESMAWPFSDNYAVAINAALASFACHAAGLWGPLS